MMLDMNLPRLQAVQAQPARCAAINAQIPEPARYESERQEVIQNVVGPIM